MVNQDKQLAGWVLQAQEGSEAAFVHLYDYFLDKIFRFVSFRIADRELAKEVTNEIFFEAWKSLKRYDSKKKVKFSTWLFTIARYTIIDQYRRKKVPTVSFEHVAEIRNENYDLHEKVIAQDKIDFVYQNISQLSEIQQTVLQLRYIEELSHAEIANIVNKTEGNVRIMVKRALEKLRKIISRNEKN